MVYTVHSYLLKSVDSILTVTPFWIFVLRCQVIGISIVTTIGGRVVFLMRLCYFLERYYSCYELDISRVKRS